MLLRARPLFLALNPEAGARRAIARCWRFSRFYGRYLATPVQSRRSLD